MTWLGLDIGGANLKGADGHGWARSVPFALWREPERLSAALAALIGAAPAADRLAITMTGELCDSFRAKDEGVRHILAAVEQAAANRDSRVYLVDGRLVSMDEARELPHLAAASNWQVLARFACRFVESRTGLLIDIGSTTADIVPLVEGRPSTSGLNDTDRLLAGELVYSGVGRTPICALTSWLPWRGAKCPVAAELFATTADAYVVLGQIPEQTDCTLTADGRPLTQEFARERLARMICADATTFSVRDAFLASEHVRDAQLSQLQNALRQVSARMSGEPECVVTSGAGEFLASAVSRALWTETRVISLADRIGGDASKCGPAYALAVLAREAADRPNFFTKLR